MRSVSWRPGCPVSLKDLRILSFSHWGFDRKVRTGRLVVHEDVARSLLGAFRDLYAERFPIRKVVPVDAYGASDFRSIEADNTSAFNCRLVEGTRRWSEHAYGRAIDINPIENPYVSGGRTSHRASVSYLDRGRRRPGMAHEGGALVRA
ncbi:MAG: M15 family metallopeptidase, partial [Actinobacteria bacterium]|nr:M15 family metallopeptidase [Actinomycetota bacterium]